MSGRGDSRNRRGLKKNKRRDDKKNGGKQNK